MVFFLGGFGFRVWGLRLLGFRGWDRFRALGGCFAGCRSQGSEPLGSRAPGA